MKIQEYGQLSANPAADPNTIARFQACDCDPTATCQDLGSQALADTVTVTGIVYTGETYTFTTPIVVTSTFAIAQAINAVIEQYETDPVIQVSYAGGALRVEHWGAGALTSVITSGTNVTMARECVREVVCTYTFSVTETFTLNATEIVIDGMSTLITVTAAVEAVLELVTGVKTVASTETPTGTYNFTFTAVRGTTTTVNDVTLIESNCASQWETADFEA
jgi:hypothetical protein